MNQTRLYAKYICYTDIIKSRPNKHFGNWSQGQEDTRLTNSKSAVCWIRITRYCKHFVHIITTLANKHFKRGLRMEVWVRSPQGETHVHNIHLTVCWIHIRSYVAENVQQCPLESHFSVGRRMQKMYNSAPWGHTFQWVEEFGVTPDSRNLPS